MQPLMYTYSLYAVFFWLAFYAWWLPEVILSFTQRSAKRENTTRQDRGTMLFLIASLYIGIFLALGLASTIPQATITWNRLVMFFAGIVITLLGIALRMYAIRILGRYFTRDVATHAGQPVIQSGPYTFIRHPAYSGTMLTMFGLGLAMTNWVSLLAIMAGFFVGHFYRISLEERVLCTTLGDPYKEYMQRTKRLIPFIL